MNKVQFVGLCLTAFMGMVFISNDALAGDGPMLFPMQTGQVRTYHYTNALGQNWNATYSVAEKQTFDGKEYFHVTSWDQDLYLRSTEDAVYSWVDGQEQIEYIAAPLGAIIPKYVPEHNVNIFRVVDRYEMVDLGALGTHRAIVYHTCAPLGECLNNGFPKINRVVYYEEFLVPGLGIVKEYDTWFGDPGGPLGPEAPEIGILTNISPSLSFCGDPSHQPPIGDLNQDCEVTIQDLAILAAHWLESTRP